MSQIIADLMAKMKAPSPELVAEAARQAASDRANEDRNFTARLDPLCGAVGEGITSYRRQGYSEAEIAYVLLCAAITAASRCAGLFCEGMLRQYLALVTYPLAGQIRKELRR
jgi:hypothetical protein